MPVYEDSTISMAVAMGAFYQHISVERIAGLRTYYMFSPWPEEMYRSVTGRIADYNFSPTPHREQNFKKDRRQGIL